MTEPSFTPALFAFLDDLAGNNDRAWFAAHKARYEAEVREPALDFIDAFAPRLAELAPGLVADSRKAGGSLFRIHRDTRFAKDKTPYKTHTGVQFRHGGAEGAHSPCLYLHLEPGNVFAAAGTWLPDPPALALIRDRIVAKPAEWKRAAKAATDGGFALGGDALKRAPAGYDPDHPLIADLRRKSFIAIRELTEADVCVPELCAALTAVWRPTVPLVRFLCAASDLPA